MTTQALNVGVYPMGGAAWLAGLVYLQDLFTALRDIGADELALCLLAPESEPYVPDELAKCASEIAVYPTFKRWRMRWALDRAAKRLTRHDLIRDRVLGRQGVMVTAFGEPAHRSRIPSLAWLPDFQHVHLPEMFSVAERRGRDLAFRRTAAYATRILCLSECVEADFAAFAGREAWKARVLRHASQVPRCLYEGEPGLISRIYALPEKFVYVPGQFWKHKNHETGFRAVRILREAGVEVTLVCSGYPGDHRNPEHFADLMRDVSQSGIRSQVAFVGVVPRDHVFMLIRQSVCVLNPSLFEGYGMTVDEARSVGKAVLLSDIPTHREQDPPGAVYFDPRDPVDLAEKLESMWRRRSPGPDPEMEREARESLPARRRDFAESFISVVREVVER